MTFSRKAVLAALAGAALLAGCATGPYYDDYGYYGYDRYGPGYDYPYYYGPGYYGPAIGLGFTYSDRDVRRRDHRDRDWRRDGRRDHDGRDRDGRDWRDRDGRDWRDREGRDYGDAPVGHGGPGGANPKDGGSPG